MPIACVYCGADHASPSEVRACWQRSAQPAAPHRERAQASPRPAPPLRRHAPAHTSVVAAPLDWVDPGPPELARGALVRTGAEPPSPWAGAPRLTVDAGAVADPEPLIAALIAHAHARQRVVLEIATDLREPPAGRSDAPPFVVGPRFWFPLDVLHHLIWSNAIDFTGDRPSWAPLSAALALGATTAPAGAGDVISPDGEVLWIDAGPVRRTPPVDGVPVVHAISIEHGSLRPPAHAGAVSELAADQRAAVEHPGATARIIAPAGSGKTRVLTERARHLLTEWGLPSSALSLVAFNKRAQQEMQGRTADLPGLHVRTLNAIALAIVNGSAPFAPQPRAWRTIDEPDVRRIIGRLVQFPRRRNTDPIAPWIGALSAIRLGLRPPAEVEVMYGGDVDGLADTWPSYRAALEREGALDFDEQVYRAIELLLADPAARSAAQRACRVLLVDEFQDLTPAHVLLLRLLAAPGFGVFGVGDDDQTIYGYNGADPGWLIDFADLFPGAVAHPLEVNYRCPGDVVAAADRLLRHNRRRVSKTIRAARPDSTGLRIVDTRDSLAATVLAVCSELDQGRAASDIAVLARVNSLLAPVQAALTEDGIAVRGGVGSEFLERTAVRAVLAWLRIAAGGGDDLTATDLAEALRRPSRPMHPNVATWVTEQRSVAGLRRLAGRVNNERDARRVAEFADDVVRLQRLAASADTEAVVAALTHDVGLGESIASLDTNRRGMNRSAQNDDLVALGQLAALHPDPATFEPWLRERLTSARRGDGVVLATVHRVKGQEWPVVVVHHATGDQYPHRLADDIEEERRVFHVALTRGREHVVVVAGLPMSPFVAELHSEPPERPATDGSITADACAERSAGRARGRAVGVRDTLFPKAVVLAAPGLVLVDGGQSWTIEGVDDEGAVATCAGARRRFPFGAAVVTAGRQRGPLRRPDGHRPGSANIRTFDLLRQARERLRAGKPAYVVFDDATLERIALALPTSLAELGRINGIGARKLEQYGDAVLLAVEDGVE